MSLTLSGIEILAGWDRICQRFGLSEVCMQVMTCSVAFERKRMLMDCCQLIYVNKP